MISGDENPGDDCSLERDCDSAFDRIRSVCTSSLKFFRRRQSLSPADHATLKPKTLITLCVPVEVEVMAAMESFASCELESQESDLPCGERKPSRRK